MTDDVEKSRSDQETVLRRPSRASGPFAEPEQARDSRSKAKPGTEQFDDIFARDSSVRGAGKLAAKAKEFGALGGPFAEADEIEPDRLEPTKTQTAGSPRETRRIQAMLELEELEREVKGQLGEGDLAEAEVRIAEERNTKAEQARAAEMDRDGGSETTKEAKRESNQPRPVAANVLGMPNDLAEYVEVRDDTVYAAVTSAALKQMGRRVQFTIPDGFRALQTAIDGSGGQMLLSGEQVEGEFILHLFREETINAIHHLEQLPTADGFKARVTAQYSVRLPRSKVDALRDFLESYVQGRSHLSLPLLKDRLSPVLREALSARIKAIPASQLSDGIDAEAAEADVADKLRTSPLAHGIEFLGLNRIDAESPEWEQDQERRSREVREREIREAKAKEEAERRAVEEQRRAEEMAQKIEREGALRQLAEKQAAGQELTREELGLLLDVARHKRRMQQIDLDREKLSREGELVELERLHKIGKLNAAAALEKLETESQLGIDRQKLAEYAGLVEEARMRLQEARVEAYILTVKDEKERIRLIEKLIDIRTARELTDEQYSRWMALQSARAGVVQSSEAVLPPLPTDADETTEEPMRPLVPEQQSAASRPLHAAAQSVSAQYASVQAQSTPSSRVVASEATRTPAGMHEASTALTLQRFSRILAEPQLGGNPQLGWVVVATGRRLHFAECDGSRRVSLPSVLVDLSQEPLGSLRSVQTGVINGRRSILVGARRGVYAIDAETRRIDSYPIEAFNPDTGVNSVLPYLGKYYATHSQYGLLRWSIPAPNAAANRFFAQYTDGARTVRSLFLDEGRWPTFACGRQLIAIEHAFTPTIAARYDGAPSVIVSVLSKRAPEARHPGWFFAVCEDGTIVRWKKDQPRNCMPLTRVGEPVTEATVSTDGNCFLIATKSKHALVYDSERGVFARYDAPTEIRLAREYGSHILGLSADRTTLYLWESRGDGRPVAEIAMPEATYDLMGV